MRMNNNQSDFSDIFIGVDGGASKCRVRIEDACGNLIGCGSTERPASVKLSPAGAWHAIIDATQVALQNTDMAFDPMQPQSLQRQRFHIGCGLTGSELPEACQEFIAVAPPCFTTVAFNSDAYTACLGAHAGDDGAIIIIGTGVVSLQIQRGKTVRVSGWGFPHGDEGSAAWLGMEATRLTFQWLDGRFETENTALLTAIFAQFNNELTKLVVWANSANSTEFAKITPLIVEYLKAQDPLATMLIQRAAEEIDRVGLMLAKYAEGEEPLPCALLGGMAPFVAPYLCYNLRDRIVPAQHDAAVGAILMVKQEVAAAAV